MRKIEANLLKKISRKKSEGNQDLLGSGSSSSSTAKSGKNKKRSKLDILQFNQQFITSGLHGLLAVTSTNRVGGNSTSSSRPATMSFHFDERWNILHLLETLQFFHTSNVINRKLFITIVSYHLVIHQIAYCEWIEGTPSYTSFNDNSDDNPSYTLEDKNRVVQILALSINAYYEKMNFGPIYKKKEDKDNPES